jgi:hypothetical protein
VCFHCPSIDRHLHCRCTSQKIGSVDFPYHFLIMFTVPSPSYYPDTSSVH